MSELVKNPETVEVIKLTVSRGDGKTHNPHRHVVQLFSLGGEFLGEKDPGICKICKKMGHIIVGCGSDHK